MVRNAHANAHGAGGHIMALENELPCAKYLRLRRQYFQVLLGGVAFFAVGWLLTTAPALQPYIGLPLVAFGVSVIWSAITWMRILFWPCPRCGKSFVLGGWSSVPTNSCKHCGLNAYASTSE